MEPSQQELFDLYRDLVEVSQDLIWQCDAEGRYIYLNPAWERTFGYTISEMLGKRFSDFQTPEVATQDRLLFARLLQGEVVQGYETVHRSKTGEEIYLIFSAKAVVNALGECTGTRGTAHDYTERKRADAALLESERKFRALFEKGPIAVAFHQMIYDEYGQAVDYLFLDANESYQKLTGVDPRGKTVRAAFPGIENDPFDWIATFGRVAKTGEEIRFETYLQVNDRWYDCVGYQYKPDHFVAAFIEVTERKRAEQEVARQNIVFTSLLQNLPMGVFMVEAPTGRPLVANECAKSLLGRGILPEASNENLSEVYRAYKASTREIYPLDELPILRGMRGESSYVDDMLVMRPDGSTTLLEVYGTPVLDAQGQPWASLVSFHDITERQSTEAALRDSEARYRGLIDNLNAGVVVHAANTAIILHNQKACELLGLSAQQLLGTQALDPAWCFVDENERRLAVADYPVMRLLAQQESLHTKIYGIVRSTSLDVVWVMVNGTVIREEHGEISELIISFIDVTELKSMERALADRSHFVESLLNTNPGILYIYDILAQKNIFSNEGITRVLGYTPSDIVALGDQFIPQLMHPDDLMRYLAEVVPRYAEARTGEQILSQYRMKDAQGRWHWIESTELVYLRNADGAVQQIFGLGLDITERKSAEAKLRESEQRLSMLFASMTEIVVLHELVFDAQGEVVNYRITDCNHAFTRITGITKEVACGKLATEVYQTPVAANLTEYARVAITGTPYEYTTYYEPADKHFAISVVSPKKNSFATITTDITGIKQVGEVIQAKNKELENYLYVASHDLRSPLVNIQGFSHRLQEQFQEVSSLLQPCALPESVRTAIDSLTGVGIPKSLNFIHSSAAKMDALINGLLQISRTGRVEMNVTKVDMNHLLHAVLAAHNFQILEVKGSVSFAGDLPFCFGDENLLNQLFSNLISNAIKYRCQQRTLQITITGAVEANKVRYCVRDNGIGIDRRHLERIWDMFFRVDASSQNLGDGLGLSIIKRIVERHKGKVWVVSELGIGSEFFVEFQKFSDSSRGM